jgi:hypothetical protein
MDPRARRKAKDFPHSPQPGYKASGYNEALDNLAAQLAAADDLDACFAWVQRFLAAQQVTHVELQTTWDSCRTYRRACSAHTEASRDAPSGNGVVVRDHRR